MLYYIITYLIFVMYKYNKFIDGSQGLFLRGMKNIKEAQREKREKGIGKVVLNTLANLPIKK